MVLYAYDTGEVIDEQYEEDEYQYGALTDSRHTITQFWGFPIHQHSLRPTVIELWVDIPLDAIVLTPCGGDVVRNLVESFGEVYGTILLSLSKAFH